MDFGFCDARFLAPGDVPPDERVHGASSGSIAAFAAVTTRGAVISRATLMTRSPIELFRSAAMPHT
nr:MAG: hypothetical protein DIU78_00615 [Pseudomonadota bacterium]